jgi:hypothetical protein
MRARISAKPLFPAKVKPEVKMFPAVVKAGKAGFEHRPAM